MFFFQAEDGIRDGLVTGVQTCALPICMHEDYRIGICSGVRGDPVKILEESFSSEEACEHAIFLKRITGLLERYPM